MSKQSNTTERTESVDYLLRRAEQESIAAIRAADAGVAERHGFMAHSYSVRAAAMLGEAASQ